MSVEGEQEFVEQVAQAIREAMVANVGLDGWPLTTAEKQDAERMSKAAAEAAVGVMVERLGPSF